MKNTTILVLAVVLMTSCGNNNSDKIAAPANGFEAGREFVRAALDGDYRKAKDYLLADSINNQLIEQQEANYLKLEENVKYSYKTSSIRPISITHPFDSVTLFRYYHSANPADTTELRMILKNGIWKVDLKSVIKM
jgi:hypothetical protein